MFPSARPVLPQTPGLPPSLAAGSPPPSLPPPAAWARPGKRMEESGSSGGERVSDRRGVKMAAAALGKQQELEAEHQDMYVEADHDFHLSTGRSAEPPAEKPGERRSAEMRKLYGLGASKIQAMETTMQLNFDRNCDKKQPKYWPIIPLKL